MKVFRLKEYSVSGENSLSRCEAERLSACLRKKKLQNVVSLTPQGIVFKIFCRSHKMRKRPNRNIAEDIVRQ